MTPEEKAARRLKVRFWHLPCAVEEYDALDYFTGKVKQPPHTQVSFLLNPEMKR